MEVKKNPPTEISGYKPVNDIAKGVLEGGADKARAPPHFTDPNWRYSNHVTIELTWQSNIQNTLIEHRAAMDKFSQL